MHQLYLPFSANPEVCMLRTQHAADYTPRIFLILHSSVFLYSVYCNAMLLFSFETKLPFAELCPSHQPDFFVCCCCFFWFNNKQPLSFDLVIQTSGIFRR